LSATPLEKKEPLDCHQSAQDLPEEKPNCTKILNIINKHLILFCKSIKGKEQTFITNLAGNFPSMACTIKSLGS
jgi:hypothetical protein